jgi:hypothetical protein
VFTPTDWPADEARKGQWTRDRFRFMRRIKETELILGSIFSNEHRDRMM